MRRTYPKRPPEVLAEIYGEWIGIGEPQHSEFLNREITGDVFYSTLQRWLTTEYGKKYPYEVFHKVCRLLEAKGVWVHS